MPSKSSQDNLSRHSEDAFTPPLAMTNTASIMNPELFLSGLSPTQPSDVDIPPMSIPIGHTTTTANLLRMDQVKALLGEFPLELFISTESRRTVPPELSFSPHSVAEYELPRIDGVSTRSQVEAYFSLVHVEIPFLDRFKFLELYESLLVSGLQNNCESALCMVVFALGSAATEELDARSSHAAFWAPGAKYISSALQILIRESMLSLGTEVALPQGLVLASKYFGYLLRPLQSWKMIHMASTSIQYIYDRYVKYLGYFPIR